jgi:undecaprenyl-diphosphatase
MQLLEGLNWGTYYFFRFEANRARALQDFMLAGDWLGSYLGVALVLTLALICTPGAQRPRAFLVASAGFLFAALLVEGLKAAIDRSRPPDAEKILGANMSSSFPCRAVLFAAFALIMLARALEHWTPGRVQRAAVYAAAGLGVVLVCVSELWLGLHWLTDVLAGLSGGIALALVGRWATIST